MSSGGDGGREVFASLTGLRFVLAVWIALYHVISLYGPETLGHHPLIMLGSARVDVFFVLSGFVLAHIYAVRTGGSFKFWPFLQARIARLYPLHVLGLLMLLGAVGAAYVLGRGADASAYTLEGLLANLFMLQATAIPGSGQWNFPAWTLSAEFFAYLLFPAFIAIAVMFRGRPLLFLAWCLALVAVIGGLWPLLGNGRLTEATQVMGIVRGACGVLVGVAARYAFGAVKWSPGLALGTAVLGAVIAGGAAVLEAPLWCMSFGGALLIAGLAGLDRLAVKTPLGTPLMQSLGDMSYALFVLHVPVFVLLTRAMGMVGWSGELGWLSGSFLMVMAMAVAVMANRLIEEPARLAIRAWKPGRKPKLA
ncbi:MAG: acyltransferase family protein [Caulobacterales bacterium]